MKKTDATTLPDSERAEPDDEPTLKQILAMMVEAQKGAQDVQRQQLKQTRLRSNAQGPEINFQNPRGQKDFPMPPLDFEVYAPFAIPKGHAHGLTREEVQLMNRVVHGECVLELLDNSPAPCSIIGTKNAATGKVERIAFMGPRDPDTTHYTSLFTKDRKQVMPTFVNFLRQVLDQQGTDYSDILTMKDEQKRIALPVNDPEHLAISVGE